MCPGVFLHTKKSKLEFDERSHKSPVLYVHFPGSSLSTFFHDATESSKGGEQLSSGVVSYMLPGGRFYE